VEKGFAMGAAKYKVWKGDPREKRGQMVKKQKKNQKKRQKRRGYHIAVDAMGRKEVCSTRRGAVSVGAGSFGGVSQKKNQHNRDGKSGT